MSVARISQLWTKNAIAEELRMNRQRVTKILKNIKPDGRVQNRYDAWYLASVIPALYGIEEELGGEDGIVDPDKLHPKDRKDWYDGTKTKIKLELDAGLVIPIDEVKRGTALLITTIIQAFENLPDLFERDFGLSGEAVVLAQETVDRVRQDAYEQVSKLPGSES